MPCIFGLQDVQRLCNGFHNGHVISEEGNVGSRELLHVQLSADSVEFVFSMGVYQADQSLCCQVDKIPPGSIRPLKTQPIRIVHSLTAIAERLYLFHSAWHLAKH